MLLRSVGVMVVRVKLRIRLTSSGREVVTSAVANAGFESDEPEVIVPTRVARELGVYPVLPANATVDRYVVAGGRVVRVYRLPKELTNVSVVTEDREVGPVSVVLTIMPGEEDVLLSDKAIDLLGIVLVKPGQGLWKFIDDPPDKLRKSE